MGAFDNLVGWKHPITSITQRSQHCNCCRVTHLDVPRALQQAFVQLARALAVALPNLKVDVRLAAQVAWVGRGGGREGGRAQEQHWPVLAAGRQGRHAGVRLHNFRTSHFSTAAAAEPLASAAMPARFPLYRPSLTFHRTSGMSSTCCAMASSYTARARSASPRDRSSSANLRG
jgi:hypothetical protein